ncbi:hypothetical protein AQJ91_37020 [Streptomyces dysideae]|uniref:Integral membrane protein n=1 Tax=Streptomyces dysideae TaxID=909626 RepID=A0A117RYI3_9ACTN|nr:hypothetical protein AQJ91_37020 [Streptomyces dysideae]
MFALVGSVLAALGHHAVAEGAVPWRLVAVFAVAQFAAAWPFARRRFSLPAVIGCTLAAQGALHLALTRAGGAHHTEPGHGGHAGHAAMATSDGHAWHHAGTAMTTAHVAAALAVAWLLHRADTAVTVALAAARTVRAAAASALARVVPCLTGATALTPRSVRLVGRFTLPAAPRTRTLDHALVRRGPPGRERVPVIPHLRARLRPARLHHQQGVLLCLRPRTPCAVLCAGPASSAPSR